MQGIDFAPVFYLGAAGFGALIGLLIGVVLWMFGASTGWVLAAVGISALVLPVVMHFLEQIE